MTTVNADMLAGRKTVLVLTNKSGGGVILGDVVIVDASNDEAFTTTTSAGLITSTVGVAQETIANNAAGRVLVEGYTSLINTSASVTRGQFGKTHTVAKQAVASASRVAGVFCQFLTGGTTPTATLFGMPDGSTGSAGSPGTPAVTLSTTNSTGVAATLLATDATIAVFDATVPVTQALGDAAAAGSAGVAARRDHKHAMPAASSIAGYELDYVEITGNVSVTATTEGTANTVVTGSAVSYNGSTIVMIEGYIALANPSGSSSMVFVLTDGGSAIGEFATINVSTGIYMPLYFRRRLTPSNASHTYAIKAYTGAGTATVYAGSGGAAGKMPSFIRITKV